ncbi:MAG: hypothetical protein QXE81_00550 [Desulfurococcaceae archaeon]
MSISRSPHGVDFSIDVVIRGRLEQYSREARDAVDYAKKIIYNRLNAIRSRFLNQS